MSMNKKKIFVILLIVMCLSIGIECVVNNNVLLASTTEYVAEKPCEENDIKRVLQIFGYILLIAKIAVPLLIIGFGTFDLFKSVVDKDEKSLGKQVKQLGIRVLAGFIVFFIPNIIYAVFSLSDKLDIIETNDYKACANCLLSPTDSSKCNVNR